MTSMPAKIMRLDNRGTLALNKVADITIFDPKTVCDVATYENPHQYSKGIEKVILSGEIIIDEGNHTNKLVGQIIK